MKKIIVLVAVFMSIFLSAKEPIVTAEKLIQYKKAAGHIEDFKAPEIVLVCYQQSTMDYLLEKHPELEPSQAISNFYIVDDGRVGVLGGWGIGSPALAIKMEQLIVFGTKQFIAVGTAGGLMDEHRIGDFVFCPEALAEDGVAHLYLAKGENAATADQEMLSKWAQFAKNHSLPLFQPAMTWSFPAIFRETIEDVRRVRKLGCSVVEMEAATLYAIGQDKGVQTLSLFVVSDSITEKDWIPQLREPMVRNNLHQLAEWALDFCLDEAEILRKTNRF